jgi:hypothetical protein
MLLDIRVNIAKVEKVHKEEKDGNNWNDIFLSYIKEMEVTNCKPAEYFKERALVCLRHKTTMYRHMAKFKEYWITKQEVYGDGAEERSMEESLQVYIAENPTELSGQECL